MTQLHIGVLEQLISHTGLMLAVPDHLPPHMRGQTQPVTGIQFISAINKGLQFDIK